MKLIVFSIFLILVAPIFVFGSEADNIIKQQKENKKKEADAKNKEESKQEAMDRCIDGVTKVIASKIKELMDKGVEFKKNPCGGSYKNIGGKRYVIYYDGSKALVQTSMYNDKFLVLSEFYTTIQFQPENGKTIYISIFFYVSNKWELRTEYEKANHVIEFSSIYNIDEIEKKQDMINNNIVKAIEAAIKYGDK